MKINIICVGKLKEKYLKDAIDEYSKRLKRFCTFSIIELPDEKIGDNPSDAEEKKVLKTEGEKILKSIQSDDYVFALCVEGKEISSERFAKELSNLMVSGKSTVDFVIGGSLGLDDEVKNRSDYKLSFSPMTFPHQLMRVILSEQIYRCFKINANEKYHK
ncbi:MAG: 23S rRNA (pseudouridine(1915)-N(3))-methyltransferase RlmH [Ruminococcaceae bacterium]|nr:23S rRNA (pseudouridine(1915)-N(3))-methyltransferase RlmH [Oscillospiraceae bacterium]